MKVENPYISIKIDDTALQPVLNKLESVLNELHIPFERPAIMPHISVVYLIGTQSLEQMEAIIDNIREGSFKIKPAGIKILQGGTTPRDYIALQLQANNDFLYAAEYVAENCEVQSFPGGFSAHVSLVSIEKTEDKEFLEDLGICLDAFTFELNASVNLSGISIMVYDKDRNLIIQKSML